mgnify:CR=1 FL=1
MNLSLPVVPEHRLDVMPGIREFLNTAWENADCVEGMFEAASLHVFPFIVDEDILENDCIAFQPQDFGDSRDFPGTIIHS